MNHPGTEIPCRIISKSELAALLQVSASTLARWRKKCDNALATVPGYNKNSSLLSPLAVRILLQENGFISPDSAKSQQSPPGM